MLGAPPAAEGSAGEGEECLKLWVTLVVHSDPIMGGSMRKVRRRSHVLASAPQHAMPQA